MAGWEYIKSFSKQCVFCIIKNVFKCLIVSCHFLKWVIYNNMFLNVINTMWCDVSSVSLSIIEAWWYVFVKWRWSNCCSPARKAKMLLDEIVSRGRGTPPSSYHESTNEQNGTVHEMMIPAGKAGLVIGKGGETIKQLQVHCIAIAVASSWWIAYSDGVMLQ